MTIALALCSALLAASPQVATRCQDGSCTAVADSFTVPTRAGALIPQTGVSVLVSDVAELAAALSNRSIDEVLVAAGTYNLSQQLEVTRGVVIRAVEPGSVVLNGTASHQDSWRVLYIDVPTDDRVELVNLSITGGYLANGNAGAGVYIKAGDVAFVACSIYGNVATDGYVYKLLAS
eukprot:CAMPEP_0115861904 /NCGR_PEP_ID=MMETSP0287-20121206/17899_1 /TAXON_ID=412157 /ORGANISM="Chrysochromulina rotalis, Strain UIO044" /LENGTH=176 /DNA_ID=CAMNT_0003316305 /DNA_START=13 /DNA_END=543 /DNA_ORIENTATION=-